MDGTQAHMAREEVGWGLPVASFDSLCWKAGVPVGLGGWGWQLENVIPSLQAKHAASISKALTLARFEEGGALHAFISSTGPLSGHQACC